ncbi:Protein of uncharacterised function (DUF3800) [Legionella pneumophila]|nr:Protein of uncharacterised function (DUF3800) [Legionella pneumophila]
MFFYIDESGNTGSNIFDPKQPIIYYGLLISPKSLNICNQITLMREKLNVNQLHARALGERLELVVEDLLKTIDELNLKFKLFTINKSDHVMIQFFDQVFDDNINPAVPFHWYNSPFRYKLLFAIAFYLFDEELRKLAWNSWTNKNDKISTEYFIRTCKKLRDRLHKLPLDKSKRFIIFSILKWAMANYQLIPFQLGKKAAYHINIVCFRAVIDGISSYIQDMGIEPSEIIVDQQSTYNVPQQEALELYRELKHYTFPNYPGIPEIDLRFTPKINLTFSSSRNNNGLELCDILLWVCKRKIEGKLPHSLEKLVDHPSFKWEYDISLHAIYTRFLEPEVKRRK